MASLQDQENDSAKLGFKGWLNGLLVTPIKHAVNDMKELGVEDPRRIVHSFKVGLAIAIVSLFYYFDFLYQGFGVAAMWAVMTVVVVFKFSVGATLGRGVNRALATLLGGGLGVGVHRLAYFAGNKADCIILGISVLIICKQTLVNMTVLVEKATNHWPYGYGELGFIYTYGTLMVAASMATYTRFYPKLKARYDYGIMIFILTFSLICVSGYREDQVIQTTYRRLTTVLIGGVVTILVCIIICPVWAGADLHKLIGANIEKLAIFMEGFGHEYFKSPEDAEHSKKALMKDYKTVLNAKGIEDLLVNFAKWEPRHGKFRYRHPWDQYLKIGALTRECAGRIDALNAYLKSNVQTPIEIRETCTKMSSECSLSLHELASSIHTFTISLSADVHIVNAETAAKQLKSSLKILWPDVNILDATPAMTVASLLIEVVSCTERIAEAVDELASSSKFKASVPLNPNNEKEHPDKMSRSMSRTTASVELSHKISIVVE